MQTKKIFLTSFVLLMLNFSIDGQILFDMGNYRNLAYSSYGYNGAYANATFGIARRDSIKLIKREVIGLLDASFPLDKDQFFTKRAIRKAFQFDLYRKKDFKIPFMFASSSIVRENSYIKLHDITAEFTLIPGFYRKKYTIALDMRYELIVLRYTHYRPDYYKDDQSHSFNPNAKNHWDKPFFSIGKVGFMAGINLKQFVIYLKSGYERNPFSNFNFSNFLPGYAVLGFGYKFGTRPFDKKKSN